MPQGGGGIPNEQELKKKAAKAMDKDDKKKMGDTKFDQYRRIRKIFQGKNKESRTLAKKVEEVLDGRKSDGDEHSKSKSKSKSKSRSKKKDDSKEKNKKKQNSEDNKQKEA